MASLEDTAATALENVAMMALAVGVAGGLWRWIGWFGLAAGGVVLIGVVQLSEWSRHRGERRAGG